MTIVNNKEEYIKALENGETEIIVSDKKLLTALYLISKVKPGSSSVSASQQIKKEANDMANVNQASLNATPPPPWVIVTIVSIFAVCALTISLYAIHKNRKIKVVLSTGTVEVS